MATQKSTLMRLNLPAQSPSGIPSRIWATGPLSCCLRCCHSCCCWPHWSDFVLSEQLFLRGCLKVCRGIIDHLDSMAPTVRREFFDRYRDLTAAVAVNVHSLIETDNCANLSIALVRWINEYMQVWRAYGQALSNAIIVHAFTLSKSENGLIDHEILNKTNSDKNSGDLISMVMNEPLSRLKEYAAQLEKFTESHLHRNDNSNTLYKIASQQCLDMAAALEQECRSAELTRSFWDSCSTKLAGIFANSIRLFFLMAYL